MITVAVVATVLLSCGSKKSLASGLPMALVLFPSATVGLSMLPLMLFHQLQLVVCSVIAGRLGREQVEEIEDVPVGEEQP